MGRAPNMNTSGKDNGFALIDLIWLLMPVVLVTIAILGYQDLKTRSKQKEALVLLSSYYSTAHTAKIEHGWFAGNFTAIGFSPTGLLNYRITTKDGTDPPSGLNEDHCISTANIVNCFRKTWSEPHSSGVPHLSLGPVAPINKPLVTNTGFRIFASSVLNLKSFQIDEWGINDYKVLINSLDGIAEIPHIYENENMYERLSKQSLFWDDFLLEKDTSKTVNKKDSE